MMSRHKTKEAARGRAASLIFSPASPRPSWAWRLTASEPEPKSRRGSPVVEDLEAVRQSTRHGRIHDAGVEVELLGKLPVDVERSRVQLAGAAACHRGAGAESANVKAALVVVVVGDAGIESGADGVSRAGPRDLQMLVDVEGGLAQKFHGNSGDADKARCRRRAWICKRDVFIAGVQSELVIGVLGQQHHAVVVGDRCRERAWKGEVLRGTERSGFYGALVFGVDGIAREL